MDFMLVIFMAIILTSKVECMDDVFLLYTDSYHHTVGTMSLNGTQIDHVFPPDTFDTPRGITYDPDINTVYMVELHGNVYRFVLYGQSSPDLIFRIEEAKLLSIALDGEGHIFIADHGNDVIHRMNINGTDPLVWITGLALANGVAVDTNYRYLIWSDFYGRTIERAPLDDPGLRQIIINTTHLPRDLHFDTSLNKLFWCEYSGQVLMANTDGTDIQVITEVDHPNLMYMARYDDHMYITAVATNTRDPNILYDIHKGTYTEIFNSTSSQPRGLALVNNQSSATEQETSQIYYTNDVTTIGAIENSTPLETINPTLDPSVTWPIVAAIVIILLVVLITIVIVVLKHRRAINKRETKTTAKSDTLSKQTDKPVNKQHDLDIANEYQNTVADTYERLEPTRKDQFISEPT